MAELLPHTAYPVWSQANARTHLMPLGQVRDVVAQDNVEWLLGLCNRPVGLHAVHARLGLGHAIPVWRGDEEAGVNTKE